MALTKEIVVDETTVNETGIVVYREATRIKEDGTLISQTYHRTSLTPGQDLDGVPENVAKIARVVWTTDVINAYQASLVKPV